ncbi:hypothetical protein ABZP36_014412 [Zizania latifolia]
MTMQPCRSQIWGGLRGLVTVQECQRGIVIVAATLSSQPNEQGCIAGGILKFNSPREARCIAFWRMASRVFFKIIWPGALRLSVEEEDVIYCKGAFHFLTPEEHIRVCTPKFIGEEVHMAEQMFNDEVRYTWEELPTLDGRMLFIGRGCSRSYEETDYPSLDGGVYFLDDRCSQDPYIVFRDITARHYRCSDNGKWSEAPPQVKRYAPKGGPVPSNYSPPVWVLP